MMSCPVCWSLLLDCVLTGAGTLFLHLLHMHRQHLVHSSGLTASPRQVSTAGKNGNRTVEFLFNVLSSVPASASGDVQSSVRYDLALDPGRLIPRAVFAETQNWTLTQRKTLALGEHCETLKLLLPVRTLVSGRGTGGRGSSRRASGISHP